ncbi:DASS family sodium-coupled anion symporter [Propionibacterium freudenreichii]
MIIGLGMFLIPTPGGLEPRAWHMLALFVATIVAIIAKVMPMGAVCLVALTISGLFGLTPVVPGKGDVGMLSGFANSTIWLIGIAMLLSRAVIKTGLGRRVALFFISVFGKKMIGVAYGFALADLVLGPGIPSASARGGGIMYPIMQSVATAYGSEPGPTARKAGSFLAIAISQIDTIVCAMFLTAMAGNPIMASLAGDLGVHMSWTSWFVGAIVPGLVALIALPYFLYKIYPPEIKDSPEIAAFARGELKDMGPMSRAEKVLTADFVLLLLLWIVGDMAFGINATVSAFIGLAILMVTSIMTWEDIIKEKAAWNTIFWFAVLVMMAGALNTYGVVGWIAKGIARGVGGIGWHMGLVVLILVFFYTRVLLHPLFLRLGGRPHLRDVRGLPGHGACPRGAAHARGHVAGLYGPAQHGAHPVLRRPRPGPVRLGLQLHRTLVGRQLPVLHPLAAHLVRGRRRMVQGDRLVVTGPR